MSSGVRIGIGHDRHRLGIGESIRVGGVTIPHDRTLLGHSDADVLLHAIIDAILGAAALGDIGEHFPDTEPENAGRNSGEMLGLVLKRIDELGWRILNVDCTVFAERPRLAAYKQDIRASLAGLLGINSDQVNIKAKTGEQVGPVGREEIIEADCVVLLGATS